MLYFAVCLKLLIESKASAAINMGAGTISDPYVIANYQDLLAMRSKPDSNYILANNIAFPKFIKEDPWIPFRFGGRLNGNGYAITQIKIQGGENNTGLFSSIGGEKCVALVDENKNQIMLDSCESKRVAHLGNIRLVADTIGGVNQVGVLAGSAVNSVFSNIAIAGVLMGKDNVGGLIGVAGPNVHSENIVSKVEINAASNIGGIFGRLTWGDLINSECGGTIKGRNVVGGCIGAASSVLVSNAISNANIIANDTIGGVAGLFVGSDGCRRWLGIKNKPFSSSGILINRSPLSFSSVQSDPLGFPKNCISETEDGRIIITNEDFVQKENPKLMPGISWVSRNGYIVSVMFSGKIKCNNNCGGIQGVGAKFPNAISDAIFGGIVIANGEFGSISGPSVNIGVFDGLVHAGIVNNSTKGPLFSGKPGIISRAIIQTADYSRRGCEFLYKSCKIGEIEASTKASNTFGVHFYPAGIWQLSHKSGGLIRLIPAGEQEDGIAFSKLKDSFSKAYRISLPAISENKSKNQFQRFEFPRFFPPLQIKTLKPFKKNSCIDISKSFKALYDSHLVFELEQGDHGWRVDNDSLCSSLNDSPGSTSSIILNVLSEFGGISRIVVNK